MVTHISSEVINSLAIDINGSINNNYLTPGGLISARNFVL